MKKNIYILIPFLIPCFTQAQNVGIGTPTPTAKLHVNGGIKMEGLNLFELGAGIAGKELNAGKMGYNAFGTNALAIVGAGTSTTNRAVYFFAEGGTTFSGPATITGNTNIGGLLQINGSSGTAGQVLTSNGTSDPTWTNAAFGNTTRFAVDINYSGISGGATLMPLTEDYNINPADVTIGVNTFTINKTGLYHFDYYIRAVLFTSSQPTFTTYLSSLSLDFLRDELIPLSASNTYRKNFNFSVDIHIIAPAVIGLGSYAVGTGLSGVVTGKLYCHLINQ